MPNPAADEQDIIAANERLTGQLKTVTAERDTAVASASSVTAERDTAIRERDEARSSLSTVTAERDTARTSLQAMTADRDRLAGESRDFNRRLAAELVKHGIRADGVAAGTKGVAEVAGTLTEQCRAALGK